MTNEKRPPRLGDLYQQGTHINDDGSPGEPVAFETPVGRVEVHVVLLSDKETDSVNRRASAAKARYLAACQDTDSDEYQEHYLWVVEATEDDRDELVAFLVRDKMAKPTVEQEAILRHSEEWAKDDYYNGLEEAWYGDIEHGELGLQYLWHQRAEQSDDPVVQAENDARVLEADRVHDELARFRIQLEEKLEAIRDDLAEEYEHTPLDELKAEVVQVAIRTEADTLYFRERLRQQAYYSTRQGDNWRKRYFETLDEWDALPDLVKVRLMREYESKAVPDLVGKGSPGIPGSSPSSEPSVEEEPSTPSGPEGATDTRTSLTSS